MYLEDLLAGKVTKTSLAWNNATQILSLHLLSSTFQRNCAVGNVTIDEFKSSRNGNVVDLIDDVDVDDRKETVADEDKVRLL